MFKRFWTIVECGPLKGVWSAASKKIVFNACFVFQRTMKLKSLENPAPYLLYPISSEASMWASKRWKTVQTAERASERAVRMNEWVDKRYLRPNFTLFWVIVRFNFFLYKSPFKWWMANYTGARSNHDARCVIVRRRKRSIICSICVRISIMKTSTFEPSYPRWIGSFNCQLNV